MNIAQAAPGGIETKVKGIFGPIITDIQNTVLWGGGVVAVLLLIVCVVKWYSAEEAVDRKQQVKWMRVIIFGYIGLNLVTWFFSSYLSPRI